ncbi:serine hydrolase domain-containing protein [Companilactobacillus sp.]|uniref:serine hydrolase domain-containing protein n=1 Tax=Companilactobacillus sp. TaxID=2767905 RepID=UPI002631D769|nr:serine hydrolase domain-containing protein [Companilactobacillus sp.]
MKKFVRVLAMTTAVAALLSPVVTMPSVALADEYDDQTEQTPIVKNGDPDFNRKVDALLKKNNFCGSVLVMEDGKPLYTKSVGYANKSQKIKNNSNMTYEIDSIQKNLTAGLIMKLVEQGKINLNDHLNKYFPNIPGGNLITLRQMLDMKSGLVLPGNGPKKVLPDNKIVDSDIGSITFSKVMLNKWQYSPINFVLLARIVEKVTHKTYKQVFTKEYIDKLHLKQTTFAYGSSHGVNKAQGYTNRNPLSPDLNYHNPYITKPFETRDELGTGQVFMSPHDLFKLENYIVSGNMLTKESRQILFVPASISTYGGGFYNNHASHSANGWGYGFQSVVHISDDGQTAVVVMSNYQRLANDNKPMASQIHSLAVQY